MSTENVFVERFQSSPIHEKLDQALLAIEQQLGFRSEAVRPILKRIQDGLQFAKTRLALVNGYLTGTDGLQSIDKSLSNILSAIEQFRGENAGQYLNKASAELENNLIPAIASLPMLSSGDSAVTALGDVVVKFEEGLQLRELGLHARLHKISDEIEATQTELLRLDDRFSQQSARVDAAVSDAQARFAAMERDHSSSLSDHSSKLDAAIAMFSAHTSELEKARSSEFSEWLKGQETKVARQREKLLEELNEVLTRANDTAEKHLVELKSVEKQARDTAAVIGNVAVAGDYRKAADSEERQANWLRAFAGAFMVAMVVVIANFVISTGAYLSAPLVKPAPPAKSVSLEGDVFPWKLSLFRIGVSLILLLPAGYCARESTRHRELARRYRRLELELASIESFMASIPADQRVEMKLELTKRYFGNFAEAAQATDPTLVVGALKDIKDTVKDAIEAIKK
jgi:hypothetical protein